MHKRHAHAQFIEREEARCAQTSASAASCSADNSIAMNNASKLETLFGCASILVDVRVADEHTVSIVVRASKCVPSELICIMLRTIIYVYAKMIPLQMAIKRHYIVSLARFAHIKIK